MGVSQSPEKAPEIKEEVKPSDLERVLAESGEEGLKEFLNSLPQKDLDRLELELQEEQQGLLKDKEKLVEDINAAQKRVVELLPEYPVSKKVAIIINGDVKEQRHLDNVDMSIKALKSRGFDEFYVIGGKEGIEDETCHVYDVSLDGVEKLFRDVGETLEKDSLVFYYGTGHGDTEGRGKDSIIIGNGQKLYNDDLVKHLQTIKEKESRGIFAFDNCYSGTLPEKILSSGVEGIAFSPGVKGKKTMCQLFAPYLFENLENFEGENIVQRAFMAALQMYRVKSGIEAYGEFRTTLDELSSESFDAIVNGDKPVMVELTATWCGACKRLAKELNRFIGVAGDQVRVLTLTEDLNEDREELYKKLGVANQNLSLPTVFMVYPGGRVEKLFVGYKPLEEILGLTKDINPTYDALFEDYLSKKMVSKKNLKLLLDRFTPYDVALMIERELSLELVVKYDAERFSGRDIYDLILLARHEIGRSIKNEEAKVFDKRFSGEDIVYLMKAGISNEDALKYDERFSGEDIHALTKWNIYYYLANRFDHRFAADHIVFLVRKYSRQEGGFEKMISDSPKIFEYDNRFNLADSFGFFMNDLPNEYVVKYDDRFVGRDILNLNAGFQGRRAPAPPEEANLWNKRLSGDNVFALLYLKAKREEVEARLDKGDDPKNIVDEYMKNYRDSSPK